MYWKEHFMYRGMYRWNVLFQNANPPCCITVPSKHASVGGVAQSFASQYEDVLAKGKIIEFNNSCSRRLIVLKDANFFQHSQLSKYLPACKR